jgi:hypothetical protein
MSSYGRAETRAFIESEAAEPQYADKRSGWHRENYLMVMGATLGYAFGEGSRRRTGKALLSISY